MRAIRVAGISLDMTSSTGSRGAGGAAAAAGASAGFPAGAGDAFLDGAGDAFLEVAGDAFVDAAGEAFADAAGVALADAAGVAFAEAFFCLNEKRKDKIRVNIRFEQILGNKHEAKLANTNTQNMYNKFGAQLVDLNKHFLPIWHSIEYG